MTGIGVVVKKTTARALNFDGDVSDVLMWEVNQRSDWKQSGEKKEMS